MTPTKLYESGSTTIAIEPADDGNDHGIVTVRIRVHGETCRIISVDGDKAKHALDVLRQAVINVKEGW